MLCCIDLSPTKPRHSFTMDHGILSCPVTCRGVLCTVHNKYALRSIAVWIITSSIISVEKRALLSVLTLKYQGWSTKYSLCSKHMNKCVHGSPNRYIKTSPPNGSSHHQKFCPSLLDGASHHMHVFFVCINSSLSRSRTKTAAGLESTVNEMLNNIREVKNGWLIQ